jgi:1-pyrroline-5-carboxylate dehydrogenase
MAGEQQLARRPEIGSVALAHRDLAAVHFTGSTATFQHIWQTVGANITSYKNYPRVVGETGGKDFIVAHPTADVEALAVACVRGAYEYQGQKCSAASRLYAPRSLWPELRDRLVALTESVVVGDPTEPQTYLGAVINARQFAKHADALARARSSATTCWCATIATRTSSPDIARRRRGRLAEALSYGGGNRW